MDIKKQWQDWMVRDPDPVTRKDLQTLIDGADSDELANRFAGRLQFGTAGLRGVVGAGPAMINRLVIREVSAGLGSYLLRAMPMAAQRGVVVGYDGRPDSLQFAHDAACVFAALGLKVYLTPDVAATPLVAFGTVHLNAAMGVVITASHNPPEYNGYKVFWENGAQIIPPHDAAISAAIELAAATSIPWQEFEEAQSTGAIVMLEAEFYRSYLNAVLSSKLYSTNRTPVNTSIAYSAMHGVGATMAEALVTEAGFKEFYSVASQREPDGRFPTVRFPNPEEPGAMDAVIALAREKNTVLACANDPDADRLAVAVRTEFGDYRQLTGDMIGVLLGNYLLEKNHNHTPIVCTTIVSSSMLKAIAEASGARYCETLTGFKWMANVALASEDEGHQFLFAYEEAIGFAAGRQVRDKDGLSALLAFAQMTEALACCGKTVQDQLEVLYRRHGLYLTAQRSLSLVKDGPSIGSLLRACPPEQIAGVAVVEIDDRSVGGRMYFDGGSEFLDIPASDVLIYRLENGARVIVRPSGTEPKFKCYYEVVETVLDTEPFERAQARADRAMLDFITEHQLAISELLAD